MLLPYHLEREKNILQKLNEIIRSNSHAHFKHIDSLMKSWNKQTNKYVDRNEHEVRQQSSTYVCLFTSSIWRRRWRRSLIEKELQTIRREKWFEASAPLNGISIVWAFIYCAKRQSFGRYLILGRFFSWKSKSSFQEAML